MTIQPTLSVAEIAQFREMLDRDAVRRVIETYIRGMDRADEASARSAYWEDGHDNHGPFDGNAQEFVTWGLGMAAQVSGHQHLLGQSVIKVNGDRATAETYFIYSAEGGRAPASNVVNALAGRYADSLERRGGEWKIAHRVVVIDWSTVWRSEERFPSVEAFVSGQWSPDDVINQKERELG